MKKLIIIFIVLVSNIGIFAQKNTTCNGNAGEDSLADLNSITKCTIKDTKKNGVSSKQLSVRVSVRKPRFMTKRVSKARSVASAKSKILSLKNNLSKEELRNAHRFSKVDEIPTFMKCKLKQGAERLNCFNSEMMNHINEYFQYPSDAVRDNIQGDVWVSFVIDKNGTVTNIRTVKVGSKRAQILDDEAMRVVSKLPNFVPGKANGENVDVKFGFPITFSLDNE